MRGIKFRAWRGFEMLYDVGIYGKEGNHCILSTFPDRGTIVSAFHEDVVVMQYTGLKDKNGKEIYEGDIVIRKEDDGRTTAPEEVYFDNGGFQPFCEPCHGGTTDWKEYEKTTEVIGNIYENPELLD